ncbi:MAG TPA: hypothetical protein VFO38_05860 [Candidatus Saccharimonadales bacterium]|nr:hypothetical protein [Candidatus Saccharimonadales bacterium]
MDTGDSLYSIPLLGATYSVSVGRESASLVLAQAIESQTASIRHRLPARPHTLYGGEIIDGKEDDDGFLADIRLTRPFERSSLTSHFDASLVLQTDGQRYFQLTTRAPHKKVSLRVSFPPEDVPTWVGFATWESATPEGALLTCDYELERKEDVSDEDHPKPVVKFHKKLTDVAPGIYGFLWSYCS